MDAKRIMQLAQQVTLGKSYQPRKMNIIVSDSIIDSTMEGCLVQYKLNETKRKTKSPCNLEKKESQGDFYL